MFVFLEHISRASALYAKSSTSRAARRSAVSTAALGWETRLEEGDDEDEAAGAAKARQGSGEGKV